MTKYQTYFTVRIRGKFVIVVTKDPTCTYSSENVGVFKATTENKL